MALDRRIKRLIASKNIELEISESYSGWKDIDMARLAGLLYLGLFIYNPKNYKRNKKLIWLNEKEKDLNQTALHEFGHFLALNIFPKAKSANKDAKTEEFIHELLAEGVMIGLCHAFKIKMNKQSVNRLKEKFKDLKIRSK